MHLDAKFPVGAIFNVSGDAQELWIADYNVRVSTCAEILVQPKQTDKKVYVQLDDIDGDRNVCVRVRKTALEERMGA